MQYAEQPTNGVTYFRAISGISLLPDDMMIYVPLFCAVITQLVHTFCTVVQEKSVISLWKIPSPFVITQLRCTDIFWASNGGNCPDISQIYYVAYFLYTHSGVVYKKSHFVHLKSSGWTHWPHVQCLSDDRPL